MIMTLREIKDSGVDWIDFCEKSGTNEWALNEGFEDSQISMTVEQAREWGILRESGVGSDAG